MTQHPPPPFQGPAFVAPDQPPPQRRKSKKLLVVLLGVGALIALCCGGGTIIAMNSSKTTSNKTADKGTSSGTAAPNAVVNPAGAPKQADATIGTAVRDGNFEFVVQKVDCGKTKIGSQYLNKTAQGQFCLVTLSVKNIGDKPQTFSDSDQKAFSDTGAEYGADSGASLYANGDQQVWLNDVNPGNSLTGTIVFDIPKGAKIARLQLHDSPFSGGAKVRVT